MSITLTIIIPEPADKGFDTCLSQATGPTQVKLSCCFFTSVFLHWRKHATFTVDFVLDRFALDEKPIFLPPRSSQSIISLSSKFKQKFAATAW